MAFRSLLRQGLVTVQLVAVPATAKADCPAAFPRRAKETDFRRAVAAASFAVRFWPEIGLSAVVLFGLCRCSICLATAGFAPAADFFDPAGSDFAAADLFDLSVAAAAVVDPSAAGPSVVAAGPGSVGSVGSAVFAACLACSVCSFAVWLGKCMVVFAVPFCFLTHQSSF